MGNNEPIKPPKNFKDSTSVHFDEVPPSGNLQKTTVSATLKTSVKKHNGVEYHYAFLNSSNQEDPNIYFKNLNEHKHTQIGNVQFESGKATLSEQGLNNLRELVTKANVQFRNDENGTLRITAHTDRDGSAEQNQKLSEKRAAYLSKKVSEFLDQKFIERIDIHTVGNGESAANQTQTLAADRSGKLTFSSTTTNRYGLLVLTPENRDFRYVANIDMGHGNVIKPADDKKYDPLAPEGSAAIIIPPNYVSAKGKPISLNFQVENPNNLRFLITEANAEKFNISPVDGQKNTFSLKVGENEVARVTFDLVGSSKDKEVKLGDVKVGMVKNSGKVELFTEKDLYANILKQGKDMKTPSELVKNTGLVNIEKGTNLQK